MTRQVDRERFIRLELLLQEEGLAKLHEASVLVVGLGGVGSSCAEALARGGVGHICLVDGDVVAKSNINRQALAFTASLGMEKTKVMTEMIHQINPACQVDSQTAFIRAQNIEAVLAHFPQVDYVIDCIDSLYSKIALVQWCMHHQVPLLASMGAANRLDPAYLKFAYVEDTSYCRMSKIIRKECRQLDIAKLEVLYSSEKAVKVDGKGSMAKADTLGSTSYMPPIMGLMLASRVIRRLAGLEAYQLTPIRAHKKERKKGKNAKTDR